MKRAAVFLPTLFVMALLLNTVNPISAPSDQTAYQDVENFHFCHRCGMAIPKTDHVITISDVPEEPWYQCCPICALMDIIESGQGNGTIHAFDNTGLQPIHIVIGDGKIKTMTPPGTILLVGGSCLTNKIFSTRTNAMAFIEKNPWAKPIMLKPVKETHALLKNKAQAINRCAMCANPLQGHEKTMMTLITKGEKRLQACCAHCGLFMAYKLKNNLIRAVIPDFKTGRLIDAQKAYYVVDNDLVVCCFPSTLSFAKRVDAQAFQKEHKGVMMTFEEALANMSKVMGK